MWSIERVSVLYRPYEYCWVLSSHGGFCGRTWTKWGARRKLRSAQALILLERF